MKEKNFFFVVSKSLSFGLSSASFALFGSTSDKVTHDAIRFFYFTAHFSPSAALFSRLSDILEHAYFIATLK
jgi:hypothetical protein